MAIKFYLEIAGKRYMLPVNPGALQVDVPTKNQTTEVVQLGEITQFAPRGLKGVSFSSFFPKDYSKPYVMSGAEEKTPEDWVALLEQAKSAQKALRLIITDTKVNMLVSLEGFSWSIEDATGDVNYSLNLKEYREYTAKYVKTVAKKVSPEPNRPTVSQTITPGCTVIVNGRLHRDSYGSGPGQTEVNATRKINFIAKGRAYPYHCTTLDGGWRGWVTAGSVRRIK